MSGGEPREWRFYVDDMVRFAQRVLANVAGLDQTAFVESELTYDATLTPCGASSRTMCR